MSLQVTIKRFASSQKHSFFKDLGLGAQNYGAYYDGKWGGNG